TEPLDGADQHARAAQEKRAEESQNERTGMLHPSIAPACCLPSCPTSFPALYGDCAVDRPNHPEMEMRLRDETECPEWTTARTCRSRNDSYVGRQEPGR